MEARGSWPLLILLAFALAMGAAARHLGLGSLSRPGPGFFPFLNAVGLALTVIVLLVQARRQSSRDRRGSAAWVMVFGLTVGITAYGVLVDYVGFILTSFGFLLFCWIGMARQPAWRSVTLAAVTTATAYFLFDYLLGVRLPRGPLGL